MSADPVTSSRPPTSEEIVDSFVWGSRLSLGGGTAMIVCSIVSSIFAANLDPHSMIPFVGLSLSASLNILSAIALVVGMKKLREAAIGVRHNKGGQVGGGIMLAVGAIIALGGMLALCASTVSVNIFLDGFEPSSTLIKCACGINATLDSLCIVAIIYNLGRTLQTVKKRFL